MENNNLQDLFLKAPGFQITEQHTPGQFNFNYRGLGNPQESEFTLVLRDGLPLMSDWIGFPTLYYLPLPQSISEIQFIRGGQYDAEFTESQLLIPDTDKTIVGNTPAFAPDFVLKGGISFQKEHCFDITLTAVYVSQQFWQDTDVGNPRSRKPKFPLTRSSIFQGIFILPGICG